MIIPAMAAAAPHIVPMSLNIGGRFSHHRRAQAMVYFQHPRLTPV